MNRLVKKLGMGHSRRRSIFKKIAISVVILFEVFALAFVVVRAWVETVSSIKIINETNTTGSITSTVVKTDARIGDKTGTIDLAEYFKSAGDMHFAPASSADGKTFYFPKVNDASNFANANNAVYNVYRKGTSADVNTTYLSASFRLKADTNADFFFVSQPAISVADDIRVSVTAYTEGDNPEGKYDPATGKLIGNTKIYANEASTTAVVNATNGATGATAVEKFSDHVKGKSSTNRLFAVGANETKIVTINIWLQKKATDNTDLTSSMSVSQAINNLAITSSLTPRHVTLIPTPTWDTGSNEYYYAWCWGATNGDDSRLYKLELDNEYEHYGFDYNGTYQNTLFLRSGKSDLTKEYLESGHWNDNTVWNVTENTFIPNDPVDPTFIIETINGSTQTDTSSSTSSTDKKSTGSWQNPVTVKLAYVTNQTSEWGTLSATSYIGTTTSSHIMEATNSSSTKHKDTVHAWAGKKLKLKATEKSGYRFVGWYDNVAGTGTVLSTDATYETDAPSTPGVEKTYFAKFAERVTLTINRYLDGSSVSTACGTITINGTNSASGSSASTMVDKGSSVTFSAEAATGYTFNGFYSAATDGTLVNSPVSINSNTTYYARFTTNRYNVMAHSRNSTDGTNYSSSDNTTGGTVQVGSAAAGASSTEGVKYKSSVTLKATAQSGYAFVGWFSSESATSAVSTSTSYSYTLNSVGDKDLYARFRVNRFTVTANAYYSTNGGTSYSSGSTGGSVKAGSAAAGSTSSASVTVGSSVTLTASAQSGYEFVGWYTAPSGGTQLSTNSSYSYSLNTYANANVYARFVQESWSIGYGVSGASNWNSAPMTVSGNNVTGSLTLTEGQSFSFKIHKSGNGDVWYGAGNASYSNKTSTSFISNLTLVNNSGSDYDIYMKGHAGTYTFTFDKSTEVLNVTVSYSNITITFDYSDQTWWGNDSAVISFYDGSGEGNMSDVANQNKKTISVSSTRGNNGDVGFNRWNNSDHSTFWNNVDSGVRGYSTTYKVGSGWQ